MHRYALTRDDDLFIAVLSASVWEMFTRAALGDWNAYCERISAYLAFYGLSRN